MQLALTTTLTAVLLLIPEVKAWVQTQYVHPL